LSNYVVKVWHVLARSLEVCANTDRVKPQAPAAAVRLDRELRRFLLFAAIFMQRRRDRPAW
jgi:hypothetical protein